ncbi:MAG: T9SS type A sorting domain-containing protein [Candidatus Delongbacteria bacterium]|jgi:PHD/YefM family antitoxin component YafN of YafNO toxin-antitoxin module|nr:T9SS type A sorting domain-containing protein [Candidatus Delongbacteria bacterium]
MRKIIVSVIFILTVVLFSQNITTKEETEKASKALRPEPIKGHVELPIFFATFKDDADPKMVINSLDVTDPTAPAMFRMPNGQMIAEYIEDNETLSFYELFKPAVQDYLNTVTKEALTAKVVYYTNPNDPDGLWRMPEKETYFYESGGSSPSPEEVFRRVSQAVIDTALVYYPDSLTSDGYLKDNLNFFYPRSIFKGSDGNGDPQNFTYYNDDEEQVTELKFRTVTLMDPYSNLNQVLYIMVHEIGHMLMRLGDRGNDESIYYGGRIDGKFMGLTKCTAPPYDLMFHNGMMGAPYSLYGLAPVHTWDMIHQTYLDSTDFAILNEEDHDLHFTNNKCEQTIRNVRQILSGSDYSSDIKSGIIIPITTDMMEVDEITSSRVFMNVESQNFLIELRDGTDFDNIGGVEYDHESKGVLISHIINCYKYKYDPAFYPDMLIENTQYYSYKPIIDIESATPYPISDENGNPYRDSTLCYTNPDINGLFYDGKDVNDWMDDVVSSHYDSEGGETAYLGTSRHASLPSDFFNDTNLNKFTPSTRPSSCSYKQVDQHLGVFIDNIVGDFADITIYKNYWSNPLVNTYLDPALKTQLYEFEGYGYFGEQFTIGEEVTLELYSGSNYTLVPETDMHIKPNSNLKVTYESQLTFDENAKLTLEENSSMDIMQDVMVDAYQNDLHEMSYFNLENGSSLKMFDGSKINGNLEVNNSGTIEVQENSIAHLDDKAKLIVQNGGKLKILSGSTFIVHEVSDLVLEDGAAIEVYEGSEIIIEKGGQIHTNGVYIGNTKIAYMSETGTWKGITSVYDNTIELKNTEFNGAETLLSSLASNILIEKCIFKNCNNGVKLESCNDYTMYNNSFEGIGLGNGIELVQSSGLIQRNSITNYEKGMHITSSSPVVQLNMIRNNLVNGLYVEGYNSRPQLIAPEAYYPPSNNNIKNNGDITLYENSAQIFLELNGMIYMRDGLNNVYSEPIDVQPDVPCILAKSTIKGSRKSRELYSYYDILAENNYWGSRRPSSGFFDLSSIHHIYYDPYGERTYPIPVNPDPEPEPVPGPKERLYSAIGNELEGNLDAAKVDYETVISEYPESDEAVVAYTKLPKNYKALGIDLGSLITLYDNKLSELGVKDDKSFFKEMKVITHILSRNYDEAILLSEEMLASSETEEEEKLAEKDIRIARMMKLADQDKGKGGSVRTEPNVQTDNSTQLPSGFALYQNYPNPFNPTTEIKFALSTASDVKLNVYNINGQIVSELVNGNKEAGIHTVNFDASNYNSGMYFYTLEANGMSITKKMILTK